MPAADGLQLAEFAREHSPGTDVYVLTGHAEFDYAQKAMEHGVHAYLLKPLSKEKLREVYIASYEKHRRKQESKQVSVIRERALLEKRLHDLLQGVPVPTFDEGLIPSYQKVMLVSFSTKDLRSLGEASVRYFIRECAYEAFSRLGTAAVCLEDHLSLSCCLRINAIRRLGRERYRKHRNGWQLSCESRSKRGMGAQRRTSEI